MRKFSILLLGVVLLACIPNISAQESEVCLVYFTGDVCGDECKLMDSFIDGLINEYLYVLTTIEYNIDASQENRDIFEAYRTGYNLPSGVPLVLFGENDYLLRSNDIYRSAEAKIYGFAQAEGTNCPLESGYIPPDEVNIDILPGQPELHENIEAPGEGEEEGEGGLTGGEDGKTGIPVPLDLKGIERMFREDPLLFTSLVIIFFLVVSLAALFIKSLRKPSENPESLL